MSKEVNLGISVYPDLKPLSEIVEYMELASKYGVNQVFSSMFSVEGTNEEILDYFDQMITEAHKFDMEVCLDVNPHFFEQIGATIEDLKVFSDIGVDILRMDLSFGAENDKILIENDYGIKIQFNSSYAIVDGLVKLGVNAEEILVCHNFYPQRYSGLRWDKFLAINKNLKSVGNVNIGAFVSSNAEDSHGVWDATDGLPTVERLRGLPIDLQARILLATGGIDDILIGNAYATEEEFIALHEVIHFDAGAGKEVEKDPLLIMLEEVGVMDLSNTKAKIVKVEANEDLTEVERDVLYNYRQHMSWGDSSEWMWRSRMPRFKYSKPENSIPQRPCDVEYFQKGDVVIVNDNYKHYCGEIQVVLLPMVNDGTRNLVGRINDDEFMMFELVEDFETAIFVEA